MIKNTPSRFLYVALTILFLSFGFYFTAEAYVIPINAISKGNDVFNISWDASKTQFTFMECLVDSIPSHPDWGRGDKTGGKRSKIGNQDLIVTQSTAFILHCKERSDHLLGYTDFWTDVRLDILFSPSGYTFVTTNNTSYNDSVFFDKDRVKALSALQVRDKVSNGSLVSGSPVPSNTLGTIVGGAAYDGGSVKISDTWQSGYRHYIKWDNGVAGYSAEQTGGGIALLSLVVPEGNTNKSTNTSNTPTVNLSAKPTSITSGSSSTLTWSSTNATSCTAQGAWSGTKATSGSAIVYPTSNSGYTLTCTGTGGSATWSVDVNVGTKTPNVSSKFQAGDDVEAANFTGSVNVRSTPSRTGAILGQHYIGDKGTIANIAGQGQWVPDKNYPYIKSGGYYWWNVTFNSGASGWVVEDFLEKDSVVTPNTPSVSLSASPSSITAGQSINLTWTTANVTSCTASGGWSGVQSINGTYTAGAIFPAQTTTYILDCKGSDGTTVSKSVTVTVTNTPPPVNKFKSGDAVKTTTILNVRATPDTTGTLLGTQPTGAKGTVKGGPTVAGGITWWEIDYVNAPDGWSSENYLDVDKSGPVLDIKANGSDGPITIPINSAATLSWSLTGATSSQCYVYFGAKGYNAVAVSSNGSFSTGNIIRSTSYWFDCKGIVGDDFVTVNVPTVTAPTLTFSASSTSITSGGSSTLTWSTTNATSCTASDGWTGTKATSGTQSVSPTATTTYTLACTGAGGTVTNSVSITVSNSPPASAPVVKLSASPSSGVAGVINPVISWSVLNTPASCVAGGDWSGTKSASVVAEKIGVLTVAKIYTYMLSCTNNAGTGSATVTVNVTAPTGTIDLKESINGTNPTDGPLTVTNGWPFVLHINATNLPSGTACSLNFPYYTFYGPPLTSPYPTYKAGTNGLLYPDGSPFGYSSSHQFSLSTNSQFYPTPSGTTYTIKCVSPSGAAVGSDSVVASSPSTANLSATLEASKDGTNWSKNLTINSGDKLYVKATYSLGLSCFLDVGPNGTMGLANLVSQTVTFDSSSGKDYANTTGRVYHLTCNQSLSVPGPSDSVVVKLDSTPITTPTTATISSDKTIINSGDTVTFTLGNYPATAAGWSLMLYPMPTGVQAAGYTAGGVIYSNPNSVTSVSYKFTNTTSSDQVVPAWYYNLGTGNSIVGGKKVDITVHSVNSPGPTSQNINNVSQLATPLAALQEKSTTTTTIPQVPKAEIPVVLLRTLSRGMSGSDVSDLQTILKRLGFFSPDVTGFYGPITEEAIKAFQGANGIVSSGTSTTTGYGVAGPKTRAKLIELNK